MGMVSAPCPWSHRTTLNQRGPRRDSASGVSSSEKLTLNYSQAVLQTNMGSCSCGLRWGEVGARSRRICPWQLLTRLRTSTGCSRSCRVLHQASSQMGVQPARIPNTETGKVIRAPVRPVLFHPGLDRMVLRFLLRTFNFPLVWLKTFFFLFIAYKIMYILPC